MICPKCKVNLNGRFANVGDIVRCHADCGAENGSGSGHPFDGEIVKDKGDGCFVMTNGMDKTTVHAQELEILKPA